MQSPGDIHGRVVDEKANGLSGVTVNLVRQHAAAALSYAPSTLRTRTTSDGSFQFSFLPADRYLVCVEPVGNLVDHCTWTPPPPVDLATGQSMALSPLRVERGYWVQIQLLDPNGYLEQNASKTANANLIVGVSTPGGVFLTSRSKAAAGGRQDLEVLVPFSTPFQVRVQSTFYKLATSSGALISPVGGVAVPSQISPTALPRSVAPIVVNVIGLR